MMMKDTFQSSLLLCDLDGALCLANVALDKQFLLQLEGLIKRMLEVNLGPAAAHPAIHLVCHFLARHEFLLDSELKTLVVIFEVKLLGRENTLTLGL